MIKKTFDVMFKRVQEDIYKACVPSQDYVLGEFINWDMCPEIEECPVSSFLNEFKMKVGEVRTLEVTIQEKAK